MPETTVVVGVIGPARGLKGEVALDVRTDRPDERFTGDAEFETTSAEFPCLTLERLSHMKGRTYAFFKEIGTREAAESVRGVSLLAEASAEDGAWYPDELKGLQVRDVAGQDFGKVKRLEIGQAQDQLIVDYQGRNVRVPFVEELVPEVDLDHGTITVDPPSGLFDADLEGN